MTYILDIVLVILFVVIALVGYLRGFAKSAWKLISLGVSVFLAYQFGQTVGKKLFLGLWQKVREGQDIPELLAGICGYILIFVCASIAMTVLGFFVKKVARSAVLAHLDSFFGLLLGVASGLLVVSVVCVCISFIIELKLSGEKTELLTRIAENSVIFRFFCEFSPFDYIHIKNLFS